MAGSTFTGFPPGGTAFFFNLAAEQSRTWFNANKAEYERLWLRPMQALLDELPARLEPSFPQIGGARAKIFRIQRDVRFAADKSPYKTHIAAVIPTRAGAPPMGEGSGSGLYLHFGMEGAMLGGGRWQLPKELLAAYREAVASDLHGPRVQAIVDDLIRHGYEIHSHESTKRVPAPYPQDHPRADLLKRRGLAAIASGGAEDHMEGPELLDWLAGRYAQMVPLINWLDTVFPA
ncbi:MAG: DUF2461 domain-containing protein [Chloroflexota bacterium]